MTHTTLYPASALAQRLRLSRIGALSQLAANTPGVINLGEGFPDFPLQPALAEALRQVSAMPVHQHSNGAGLPALRQWVANRLPWPVDPDTMVTITCGATQALSATLAALLNPGDIVLTTEPFYEPYLNMIWLAGGQPRLRRLEPPDWAWHAETPRSPTAVRAVLWNNPHNPTTRVFTPMETRSMLEDAAQQQAWVIHDAVYADWCAPGHLLDWPATHGYDQVVTIGSFSKSLGITGWRLGYVVAPPALTRLLREIHEVQTCEAPVPLQTAVMLALHNNDIWLKEPFQQVAAYRDTLQGWLQQWGAYITQPQGSVYLWACLPQWGDTAQQAAERLLTEKQVLAIPADAFYDQTTPGPWLRWCYLKQGLCPSGVEL